MPKGKLRHQKYFSVAKGTTFSFIHYAIQQYHMQDNMKEQPNKIQDAVLFKGSSFGRGTALKQPSLEQGRLYSPLQCRHTQPPHSRAAHSMPSQGQPETETITKLALRTIALPGEVPTYISRVEKRNFQKAGEGKGSPKGSLHRIHKT